MCSRPHFTGKPDWPRADFAENCLLQAGSKASAVSRFREKLSAANGVQGITAISRKIALLGVMSAKLAAKKLGSNMRPRYIRFRDIHDHDISGLHCITYLLNHATQLLSKSFRTPLITMLFEIAFILLIIIDIYLSKLIKIIPIYMYIGIHIFMKILWQTILNFTFEFQLWCVSKSINPCHNWM